MIFFLFSILVVTHLMFLSVFDIEISAKSQISSSEIGGNAFNDRMIEHFSDKFKHETGKYVSKVMIN